jgi:hypothetical protein
MKKILSCELNSVINNAYGPLALVFRGFCATGYRFRSRRPQPLTITTFDLFMSKLPAGI